MESISGNKGCQFVLEGPAGFYTPLTLAYQASSEFNIQGFIQRLDNYLNKFENNISEIKRDRERKAAELVNARQRQGQPFPQADLLNALRQDNREVMRELQISQKDPSYKSTWRPQSQAGVALPAQAPDNQAISPQIYGPSMSVVETMVR
ncbi:MAG: hypothetical protein LBP33_12495 [Candidatus Adiutrix sp.]|nr:hypothetical protein [Candidatus Adiutrix sp.]